MSDLHSDKIRSLSLAWPEWGREWQQSPLQGTKRSMRQHPRSLRQHRPLVDSLEGRELLSRLYEMGPVPTQPAAVAVLDRGAGIPSSGQVFQNSGSVSDHTDTYASPANPEDV